jgi:hypothetical protein
MTELSPEREWRTTASQAPTIVNGSAGELFTLWEERVGARPSPDFTDHLPVQLGKYLEGFILDWVERTEQCEITERQHFIIHPTHDQLAATIDGYRAFDDAVVEAKVIGPFRKREEWLKWYAPQVVVQRWCRQCTRGYLCVLQGIERVELHEIETDEAYEKAVMERLLAFQLCVDTMTPPVANPNELVPPERWRTIDLRMVGGPNWGPLMRTLLDQWNETYEQAQEHKQLNEDIRKLLPADVGRIVTPNVTLRRNKAGAVSIKREAA